MELQANMFASNLLLPLGPFVSTIERIREHYGYTTKRGHGYIYVDNQPCNQGDFYQLLSSVSSEFEASKQVVEIKLKKLGMLNDHRT